MDFVRSPLLVAKHWPYLCTHRTLASSTTVGTCSCTWRRCKQLEPVSVIFCAHIASIPRFGLSRNIRTDHAVVYMMYMMFLVRRIKHNTAQATVHVIQYISMSNGMHQHGIARFV